MINFSITRQNIAQLGASLVEMGLLVALVSVICMVAVKQTGQEVNCTLVQASLDLGASDVPYEIAETCCAQRGMMYSCTAGPQVTCACSPSVQLDLPF